MSDVERLELESDVADLRSWLKEARDLNESAWGIIANAWNGNWDEAPEEWLSAAIRWRDQYHETLPPSPSTPSQ